LASEAGEQLSQGLAGEAGGVSQLEGSDRDAEDFIYDDDGVADGSEDEVGSMTRIWSLVDCKYPCTSQKCEVCECILLDLLTPNSQLLSCCAQDA
jgi:hypothetical protein